MNIKNFKVGLPIACVWLGTLIGPSMLTGVFCMTYFAPYGGWTSGLIMLFAYGITVFVVCMAAEVTRRNNAYDFGALSHAMYGRYEPILGRALDLVMVCSVLVNTGALISVWNTMFATLWGLPAVYGTIGIVVVCTLATMYGAGAVRKISSILTVVMLLGMIAMIAGSITINAGNLGKILGNTKPVDGYTMARGYWKAFVLAGYQVTIAPHLCAVEQTLKSKRDTAAFGISSLILIILTFFGVNLIILPYINEMLAGNVSVPILTIINTKYGAYGKLCAYIYFFTMFFAIVSSIVPMMQSCILRFGIYFPDRGMFKNPVARSAISGIIYWIISILVSLLGLITIVSKAWQYLGYLAIAVITIPCCITMPIKWYKEKKVLEQKESTALQ